MATRDFAEADVVVQPAGRVGGTLSEADRLASPADFGILLDSVFGLDIRHSAASRVLPEVFQMATTIPPTGKVTFQISTLPATPSAKKTVMRLMRMNPRTQRTLSKLSHNRVTNLHERRPRAGRMWLTRVGATRLVKVAVGEKFTLSMTPQIVNDVKSVEQYLTRL